MLGHRPSHLPTILVGCFVVAPAPKQGSISSLPDATERQDSGNKHRGSARTRPMNAQQLPQEISDYCRPTGFAQSPFGRRAVNDGKLASRLRNGGRITTDTLDRIRAFMAENPGPNVTLRRPGNERNRKPG